MARISAKEFIGTRGRLHRVADGTVVSGWVRSLFGTQVEVQVPADTFVQIGDVFRFELHGAKVSAVFEAALSEVEQYDSMADGSMYQVEGSNVRVIEAEWVILRFSIQSQFRFANAIKAFRSRVKGISVTFQLDGSKLKGDVVDVGERGFGAILSEPIIPGTKLNSEVTTSLGVVSAVGLIRYCNSNPNGTYRAGVELVDMGRLDKPRWLRYVSEL